MRVVPTALLSLLAAVGLALAAVSAAAGTKGDPGKPVESPAAVAAAVTLRHDVVVADGLIRLGDLFTIDGDAADVAVAYAPRPGRRAVFDARWLWRVARAHRVDWQPMSRQDRVVVERDSVVVGREDLEALVLGALSKAGIDTGSARISLANTSLEIALANDPAADVVVDDVAFDPDQNRFVASLVARDPGGADRRLRVAGRLEPMTELPVPTRRIAAGEVLGAGDVTWVALASRRVQRDTITDPDQLIGMMSRRPLPEGAPVRAGDMTEPVIVARGESVTIVLATPLMVLTARGRALEDGSRGAVIRVANAQSRSVIEAAVTGPGRVEVDLGAVASRHR